MTSRGSRLGTGPDGICGNRHASFPGAEQDRVRGRLSALDALGIFSCGPFRARAVRAPRPWSAGMTTQPAMPCRAGGPAPPPCCAPQAPSIGDAKPSPPMMAPFWADSAGIVRPGATDPLSIPASIRLRQGSFLSWAAGHPGRFPGRRWAAGGAPDPAEMGGPTPIGAQAQQAPNTHTFGQLGRAGGTTIRHTGRDTHALEVDMGGLLAGACEDRVEVSSSSRPLPQSPGAATGAARRRSGRTRATGSGSGTTTSIRAPRARSLPGRSL